jgi:RNA polymerase sigma-70 factor (ECF subfamily)
MTPAELYQQGRAAWPDVATDAAACQAHFASLSGDLAPHAAELYLAFACAKGEPHALAAFERDYGTVLHSALAALALSGAVRDDLAQSVRTRLFVAGESRPKILEYSGRGDLAGFLRVLTTRVGLRHLRDLRRRPQEQSDEDASLLDRAGKEPDAELAALERRFGPELKAAFLEALKTAEPKDQNLLRQRFLDDLSWEQLAALHRVHRATVIRWLAAARHALFARTQEILMERTGMHRSECVSLIRAMQPDVGVTLRRILGG